MSNSELSATAENADGGFAVAVARDASGWRCSRLPDAALSDLSRAVTELRQLRVEGAVFGMLAVDDEFFVLLRLTGAGESLMLSDAYAALDYDLAADVVDVLREEPPEEPDDDEEPEVWPVGHLSMLADLGLPADVLEVIVDEVELYPDEQLQMIAESCGFAAEFDELLQRTGS